MLVQVSWMIYKLLFYYRKIDIRFYFVADFFFLILINTLDIEVIYDNFFFFLE